MIQEHHVDKPQQRGRLRRFLGKEFFIFKRHIQWMLGDDDFAKVEKGAQFGNSLIKHRSFLLRPLKDVDMYLQHNKVTNLKIAISHLDKVVIKPGQTFSIWRHVGRPIKLKG
jgi:vancomycin resistance protein VanW